MIPNLNHLILVCVEVVVISSLKCMLDFDTNLFPPYMSSYKTRRVGIHAVGIFEMSSFSGFLITGLSEKLEFALMINCHY